MMQQISPRLIISIVLLWLALPVHAACDVGMLDHNFYQQGITRIDKSLSEIRSRNAAQPGHRRSYLLPLLQDAEHLQGSLRVMVALMQLRPSMTTAADTATVDAALHAQIVNIVKNELHRRGDATLTLLPLEDDPVLKREYTAMLVMWNEMAKPLQACMP